ncbi:MAG: phosphatidylglycerophosphatase A [Pyrinomonadaceae bacterium]
MVVKESTDELSPPVNTTGEVSAAPEKRLAKDYLALGIATCGVGYLPLAPGTWGSLLGVGIYFLIRSFYFSMAQSFAPGHSYPLSNPHVGFLVIELIAITVVTLAGIWAGTRTERLLGRKDPGKVVIDEVAGQLISLLPIPLIVLGPDLWLVVIAFVSFRFFDIIKPYPARRFESLKSGWGIMADDLVAGVYAAGVVAFAGMALHRIV